MLNTWWAKLLHDRLTNSPLLAPLPHSPSKPAKLPPLTPPKLFPTRVTNELGGVKSGDQSRCPPHLQYSKRHVTQLVTSCPSKHFLTRCLSRSVSSPSDPWAGDNGGPQVLSSLLSPMHALWTNTNSCGLKYHISVNVYVPLRHLP